MMDGQPDDRWTEAIAISPSVFCLKSVGIVNVIDSA